MSAESPWLTPEKAAEYLGNAFEARSVRAACRSGKLQHTRPGGNRILLRREWLDAWCMASVEGGKP